MAYTICSVVGFLRMRDRLTLIYQENKKGNMFFNTFPKTYNIPI